MMSKVSDIISEARARGIQYAINDLRSAASITRGHMERDGVRLDSLQTWASMEVAAEALERLVSLEEVEEIPDDLSYEEQYGERA